MNKLLIGIAASSLAFTMGCQDDPGPDPDPAPTETTWYQDADSDTYGNPNETATAVDQPLGYVANNLDCNDDVNEGGDIHPDGTEVADGTFADENCDGTVDEIVSYIFVTSTTSGGNLGGLDGADATCQSQAAAAGLPGTYKAWLSDSITSAASRLTYSSVPYVTPDAAVVANDWSDFTDGTTNVVWMYADATAPNPTHYEGVPFGAYTTWTNTNPDGSINNVAATCDDWGSDDALHFGGYGGTYDEEFYYPGMNEGTPEQWTAFAYLSCEDYDAINGTSEVAFHLLCLQQ